MTLPNDSIGPNVDLLVPEDVRRIVALALDVGHYRTVSNRELGEAAWLELRDAVQRLPEAKR